MTLSYKAVRDADLAPLSEAVTKWRNLPGQFDTIATSFKSEVSRALRASDWEGEAAEAAFKNFTAVEKQMDNASEEARDVHQLLSSALESFRSAQKQIRDVASDVAEDRNLKLSPVGLVYLDPDDRKEPNRLAVLKQAYEDVIRGYNDRIKTALSNATEADTALHWALSQDPNGRSPGFHPNMFNSVKDAQKARREARKDADTLVKLAALGRDMTDEQLVQFNRLLRKHEGDPYFAERFATKVGPEGVLRFWQGVADQRHHSDEEARKTLAKIQKSLSHTLAAATHSQSDAMLEWKKEMVKLGDEQIHFSYPDMIVASEGSYGFSIMSSLMRHGEFETDFLKDYGEALFSFESEHKGDLKDLWYVNGHKAQISFGSDAGNDPMAGYLEALGHNPEAAKEMFDSKKWNELPGDEAALNSHLKYLLDERKWLNDSVEGKKGYLGYGYDELGHALESATLGIPYDRPDLGLKRDETTANIMSQVVTFVSEDVDFAPDRPGVGNSLAKMGAGYIDDLTWAVSDFGKSDYNENTRESAFRHREGSGHFSVDANVASKFLAATGRNEGSYEILAAAQQEYTAALMRAHSGPDDEAKIILETGAKFNGIIDGARSLDIQNEYGEAKEEKERKLTEAAEWEKFAVSQGIGLGVGILTLPFGGAAVSSVVTVAVPAIIEGAASATETQYEISLDRQLEERMKEFEKDNGIDPLEFYSRGKIRSVDPLDAFVSAHGIPENDPWLKDLNIETLYDSGRNDVAPLFE
ncbi:PPE domain-containing protein [Streptomyces megasporus]|uniref:PPE domain-containing protein n=1 Tax=Streptomyces megasporus TaxID=44060 RepID=UPI0004E252BF|nr:PPE domain-containing protein [Streptomyces megasporus]